MDNSQDSAKHAGEGGFTLIEVLVVVAVIALLIAILLPSLARARALARSTQCQTNLRQQGYSALMYANDNRRVLPGSWSDAIERLPWLEFRRPLIYSYKMKGMGEVFYCPANTIRPWVVSDFFLPGNSGSAGKILYWWVANPPKGISDRFLDTNGQPAGGNLWEDEYIIKLDQKWPKEARISPDKAAMSTDQSRQQSAGWYFFHGGEGLSPDDAAQDTRGLSRSWKNTLYGDMHVAHVRAFKVIKRWGPANPAGW